MNTIIISGIRRMKAAWRIIFLFMVFIIILTYYPGTYAQLSDMTLNNKANLIQKSNDFSPDNYETDNSLEHATEITADSEPQQHNFHAPGDEDWIRFYGFAGETYAISAYSYDNSFPIIIKLYDADGATLLDYSEEGMLSFFGQDTFYYISISNPRSASSIDSGTGLEQTDYEVMINTYLADNYDEDGDDDSPDSANVIVPDAEPQTHNIHEPGDEDWVKFYGVSGESYEIEAVNLGGGADLVIEIYDEAGTLLTIQDNTGNPPSDEKLTWSASGEAVYYIRITNSDPTEYGETIEYELSVSTIESPMLKGFIEGVVTDSYSGNFLGDVRISTSADITTLSSSDNGSYLMVHSPGTYTITAEISNYEIFTDSVTVEEGGYTTKDMEMIPLTGTVAIPIFSPLSGTYTTSQQIEITCNTPDAVIYYAVNNQNPTESSSIYVEPITVAVSTTISARAYKPDWTPSDIATEVYNITGTVAEPIFTPGGGIYTSEQLITLSCAIDGAEIYYTMDDTEPTEYSMLYTEPVPVSSSTTLKARAFKTDWSASSTAAASYTITGTVGTPVFSPSAGTYITPRHIEISCGTPDAVIYYTTDGKIPTKDASLYSFPLTISDKTVVKARAFKSDWIDSKIATAIYTITGTVGTPVFSPSPGTYETPRHIDIACATPDALIRYTTDGTEPDEAHSPIYENPVSIPSTTILRAKAFKTGWESSDTITGTYVISGTVARPTFSPGPGIYDDSQTVEIFCATDGTVIYYTLDGREPTQDSEVYAYPLSVTESTTIKAKAFKDQWLASETASGNYTILRTVETPVFSLSPGIYTTSQVVEISCVTPDSTIRYTLDGSDPAQNSAIYTSPLSVTESMAIKARAFRTNWLASEIISAAYVITGTVAAPVFSIAPGAYPEPQTLEISCTAPEAVICYTTDGTTPTENSNIYTGAIAIAETLTISAKAFQKDWNPSETVSGTYMITGTVSTPLFSPSPGIYTTSQQISLSCVMPDAVIYYTTDGTEPDEQSEIYTSPITVSESMTIKTKAFKTDWNHSETASGTYTITGTVAVPVFSITPGTYTQAQHLEISCSTPEAVIYYTTDGTEPSENSHVYTGAVTITTSLAVKTKAFRQNWNPSETVSGNYVITGTVSTPLFSPSPGIYTTKQDVGLSCIPLDAEIHYTLDGAKPDEQSEIYTSPIMVSESMTIKAKAFKTDWNPSDTASGTYTITGTVAAPVFSIAPGIYSETQKLEISCATPEAVIYYTTDGTDPTENSEFYTGTMTIEESVTINAKAFKSNWNSSETVAGTYMIIRTVNTPLFFPSPGIYTTEQAVKLFCTTPETVIYFTTDGTEPDESSGIYTSLITVSESMTIKAKAYKTDWNPSDTKSGTYTITGTVAEPVFSMPSDIYDSPQTVELSCTTPDAVIYYTLDGTEPDESSGIYSSAISVTETITINAKAFKPDWNPSDTSSGVYIIDTIENPDSDSSACFLSVISY